VRILLTGQPIFSHLMPALVPLARCAMSLGHEVVLATAPGIAAEVARTGVPVLPLPEIPDETELRTDPRWARRYGLPERVTTPGRPTIEPGVARQIARAYAGPIAGDFAAALLDTARRWGPDVVVREPAEYGGYLVAEVLGVPHVTLDISPYAMRELPLVIDVLDRHREVLGLPPTGDPWHVHRHLRAGLVPSAWYPPELWLPTARDYRLPLEPVGPPGDGKLAQALAELPDDRPVVLASLGSLVPSLPGMIGPLRAIVRALGRLHCCAVLSLGGRASLADELGPVAENILVAPFVPQRELLGHADLFITHAGFGAVRESLDAGVPVVALPVLADQPANASRLAELGLGVALPTATVTAELIVDACRRVLDEPAYRLRARAWRRRVRAAPGPDRLLADLAALVTTLDRPAVPERRGDRKHRFRQTPDNGGSSPDDAACHSPERAISTDFR
jgi:UDP:flavonoid glycosyltransferase YjiC (YdhE family)